MFEFVRRELARAQTHKVIGLVWLGLLVGLIIHVLVFRDFILDSNGRPLPADFLALWSAGQMFVQGHAADAYNYPLLRLLQVQDVGHSFTDYCPWNYPPLFLFVVGGLAQMPYVLAYALWATATLVAYGFCMKAIFRDGRIAIIYGAAPASLIAFIVGQTGLLVAAIFGAMLLTLNKRTVVSGLLLAALAFKPQFGILIPVALAAAGYWTVIIVASLATGAWISSWLLLDPHVFPGFFHSLAVSSQYYLKAGSEGWHKLQSVYGFLRMLGVDGLPAAIVQGLFAAACLFLVVGLWRSSLSPSLKAAVIAVAALVVTPYSYMYDFPILTVAIGFLYRGIPFDRFERIAICTAYGLEIAYLIGGVSVGWVAAGLIGSIIARRVISKDFSGPALLPPNSPRSVAV